jgi:hypothetical protein
MTSLLRLLSWRLSSDRLDRSLGLFLILPAGPALLALALVRLAALDASPAQTFLGLLLALTGATLLVTLALVVYRTPPARCHLGHVLCFGGAIALLVAALLRLSTLTLTPVEALLGVLLSLTACLALINLGLLLPLKAPR